MMAEDHFLNRFRSLLIQQISNVDPVLDNLLDMGFLTHEQYDLVMNLSTLPGKMRKLYDYMRGWSHRYKDEVCQLLKENNPRLRIFEEWIPDYSTSPSADGPLPRVDASDRYGDISNVQCSGASQETANRNGLSNPGVQTSHLIADQDAERLEPYKAMIQRVASRRNLHPALIAAIISRESRFGVLLQDGWGSKKQCFGLMQVSKTYHDIVGEWNSEEHIDQAAGILVDMIRVIKGKFPEWQEACQLKGGVAAYNCGPGQVTDYNNIDEATVTQDYSNDVLARAQWFKTHCF